VIALIDADTLCYASAAMAEGESAGLARYNANSMLDALLARLNNPPHKLFITGEGNFRYKVYPEYKANRLKVPRPEFLPAVQEYVAKEFGATVAEGMEADDLIGIEQCAYSAAGQESLISTIDKDLDMIPGWHYSPEIKRLGVVIKEARRYLVSPTDAIRFFYYQLLVGDPTDNIKGVPGIGKVGAAKMLAGLTEERDLLDVVRDAYDCDEAMLMNGKCLWIWRKENDVWKIPDFGEAEGERIAELRSSVQQVPGQRTD
jgi:5'-3' exonuclease